MYAKIFFVRSFVAIIVRFAGNTIGAISKLWGLVEAHESNTSTKNVTSYTKITINRTIKSKNNENILI
jgi:hypothetical protein